MFSPLIAIFFQNIYNYIMTLISYGRRVMDYFKDSFTAYS